MLLTGISSWLRLVRLTCVSTGDMIILWGYESTTVEQKYLVVQLELLELSDTLLVVLLLSHQVLQLGLLGLEDRV